MQFRCERCGETVSILDDTQSLNCKSCGAELVVQRSQGTISLKIKPEKRVINNVARFIPELVDKLSTELTELNAATARIRRRKAIVAVVGGCCGLVFAGFGIYALLSNDSRIGLTMLFCAVGCSWFILFVQRDSTTEAAKMAVRVAQIKYRIAENQRICFAAKKGVHRVAVDLFLREIRYYPAWIQHSRSHVPIRVTEAVKVDTDSVRLTMGGSKYLFTLAYEHRNAECAQIVLNLLVDDSLVLSAGAEVRENQLAVRTSGHYVNTIVDGPWIEELFALWGEAEISHHETKSNPLIRKR